MKPLTKLQEVDLINELYDKVWELEKRFEEKYGVSVRSNYTIDKIKIEVKDTPRKP
jgi:hypothetical protein